MAVALTDRLARRVSAGTRIGRVVATLAFGGVILIVLFLCVLLAYRPALRRQFDWTTHQDSTPSPELVARLRVLESPVTVTVFTSERAPRHLELLTWLAGLDEGQRTIAAQEARVRLEALESLRFWLDRCAQEAPEHLHVEWLDREARAGAYHRRFAELGLGEDLRAARLASLFDVRAPGDAPMDQAQRTRDRFPGLIASMRRALSPEAIERWSAKDYVDFVVVSCEDRRETYPLDPNWVAIEHSDLLMGGVPRAPRFVGMRVEGALLGALERVSSSGAVTVAGIAGHGQDPRTSRAAFLSWLARHGYDWRDEPVDLQRGEVPPEVDVLVAWNVDGPFTPAERGALATFRGRGGGLVVAEGARLGRPSSPWNALLRGTGGTFGGGPLAVGDVGSGGVRDPHLFAVRRFFTEHEVVQELARSQRELWFRDARALLFGGSVSEGGTWTAIATLDARILENEPPGVLYLDVDGDGRFSDEIALPLVHVGAAFDPATSTQGRIVLVGATTAFDEEYLPSQAPFVDAALRFAARRTVTVAADVRAVTDARMDLFGTLGSAFPEPLAGWSRREAWKILCLYTFPCLVLALALSTWWLRRRG